MNGERKSAGPTMALLTVLGMLGCTPKIIVECKRVHDEIVWAQKDVSASALKVVDTKAPPKPVADALHRAAVRMSKMPIVDDRVHSSALDYAKGFESAAKRVDKLHDDDGVLPLARILADSADRETRAFRDLSVACERRN